MKKLLLVTLAAGTAMAVAAPANAQVTGTVDITGTVASKCAVIPAMGAPISTFGTTVALGELAQADGTMKTDLDTTFNAAAGLTAHVVCTSGAPTVAIDADPIVNTATPATGYSSTINYSAKVAVTPAGGTAVEFTNLSSATATAAAPLGGPIAATGPNVAITTSGFTAGTGSPLLVAGSYTGKITVVIAPGA